jgi:2-oxoglutarate dehydrogenase E1 component
VLVEGYDVRLAGQDTRRGTFSQRHSTLFDYETGVEYTPLANIREAFGDESRENAVGRFMVYDSLLSEFAALGFEYGYSVESPDALVLWEAQFGDFANGAQVIIDNFLASAGDKWGQSSALTLLLPHGYEGQGPEHSSARLERFLTICAENNLTIAQPTNAAQYFHLLRAQAHRSTRRPLVVMTPKSLLRARQARSAISELVHGSWREVLDDDGLDRQAVERLILCSGKVAYDAMARRDRIVEAGGAPVAVARVEQLYPWPEQRIGDLLAAYPDLTEVVWLQEEPENMGAWSFVHGRLHRLAGTRYQLRHVSRAQSGSPATGSSAIHQLEHEDLLERSVGSVPG